MSYSKPCTDSPYMVYRRIRASVVPVVATVALDPSHSGNHAVDSWNYGKSQYKSHIESDILANVDLYTIYPINTHFNFVILWTIVVYTYLYDVMTLVTDFMILAKLASKRATHVTKVQMHSTWPGLRSAQESEMSHVTVALDDVTL